jgi:hypothetical protein
MAQERSLTEMARKSKSISQDKLEETQQDKLEEKREENVLLNRYGSRCL